MVLSINGMCSFASYSACKCLTKIVRQCRAGKGGLLTMKVGGGGFKWWKDNFKIGCSKFAFRKVIKVEGPYAPPSQLVASSKQFYLVLQGWCFGLVFFLAVVVFFFSFQNVSSFNRSYVSPLKLRFSTLKSLLG